MSKLFEEHGQIDLTDVRRDKRPRLGDRLRIIPNHICPCVHHHGRAWCIHEDGQLEQMNVDARGGIV